MRLGRSNLISGLVFALLSASALGTLCGPEPVQAQGGPCVAHTAYGDVVGVPREGACTYLGVPYAASTAGNNRWKPPQTRAPWSPAVLQATATAPACPQINMAGALAGSEDCLTMNIWTPAGSGERALPVLLWLVPGSFLANSSNFAATDGRRFAEERSAIVVAPNYRVGAFGFLGVSALSAEDPGYPSSGNYGLADQRAALRWVRDNIIAFGGDPANVTLGGTSAGAISTSIHIVSPLSRGLFRQAIIESGFATMRLPSAADSWAQGETVAAALSCTDRATMLACLRGKTRDQVLSAVPPSGLVGGFQEFVDRLGRASWGPSVDGLEVPDQPRELYRRGQFARVPVILGSNRDDGWTFVDRSFPTGLDRLQYERAVRDEFGMDADAALRVYESPASTPKDVLGRLATDVEFTCEARRMARELHHEGSRVFLYSFEYSVNEVNPGRAFHGIEASFVFGNNFAAPVAHVLTPPDLVVYDAMSRFWRRFMQTGDPNPPGVAVQWPTFRPGAFEEPVDASRSDRYFIFGEGLGVSTYLRDRECNFWEPFFFRSAVTAVPAAAR